MRKLNKKIIIMLTFIFAVGLLGGCGNGSKEASSMGRYIEEGLTVPSDIMHVTGMDTLEDGTITLMGYPKEGPDTKCYISKDGGQNWEEKNLNLPAAGENQSLSLSVAKILNDGSVFAVYSIQDNAAFEGVDYESMSDEERVEYDEKMQSYYENLEYTASIISEDGSITEVTLDNDIKKNLYECYIDKDNNLFYNDHEKGAVVQADLKTGEVVREFVDESGYVQTWCVTGDELVTGSFEGITTYDLKSGKEKSKLENKDGKAYGDVRLYKGKESGEVYSCTNDGVYKLEKGKTLTQIIDGTLSTFGDQNNYLQGFLVQENNEFLALFSSMEEQTSSLIKYKFDAEIASKPENQITVYSLMDDYTLKQAVVMFQKNNPDVYVNLEIGMTGYEYKESDINDAVKRLNTEVMAGKGPDVLLLDGLPIKSYVDKGMLADISDILGGKDNKDLFTNILYSNEGGNGEVYAAPLKFNVPVIYAKNPTEINTLSTLAANIEEISKNAEGTVLNVYEPEELAYLLYKSCGNAWVNEDKSINKENIKAFLENAKVIYDSVKDKHSEADIKSYEEEKEMMAEYLEGKSFAEVVYSDYFRGPDVLLTGNQEVLLSTIYSASDFEMMQGVKEMKPEINYDVWKGQDTNAVIPMQTIGVNAKSGKIDIAKDFVELLFSEEYQKSMKYHGGITVNKKVFKDILLRADEENGEGIGMMGIGTPDGGMIEIEMKRLSEEVANEIIEKIESLNSSATPDKEIMKKSIDEFKAYIGGEKSMDDTLKAIENKLEIYLAE